MSGLRLGTALKWNQWNNDASDVLMTLLALRAGSYMIVAQDLCKMVHDMTNKTPTVATVDGSPNFRFSYILLFTQPPKWIATSYLGIPGKRKNNFRCDCFFFFLNCRNLVLFEMQITKSFSNWSLFLFLVFNSTLKVVRIGKKWLMALASFVYFWFFFIQYFEVKFHCLDVFSNTKPQSLQILL